MTQIEIHHTIPFSGADSLRICDGSKYGIVISPRYKILLRQLREEKSGESRGRGRKQGRTKGVK
jgi:hypothetical protein